MTDIQIHIDYFGKNRHGLHIFNKRGDIIETLRLNKTKMENLRKAGINEQG